MEEREAPNIDSFGYNEHCNQEGNHIKGVGSIHLLNVGMQFIINHYKLLKDTQFQLKDTSFIECSRYKLSLPVYYTVFYGKTWYEQKFDAVPLYISADELKGQRQKLREYMKTKPPLTDWFMGSHEVEKMIEKIYVKTGSLQECLDELKSHDCYVFKNWLPALVLKYIPVLIGTEWSIVCRSNIDINIEKLSTKPKKLFKMEGGDGLVISFKQDEL